MSVIKIGIFQKFYLSDVVFYTVLWKNKFQLSYFNLNSMMHNNKWCSISHFSLREIKHLKLRYTIISVCVKNFLINTKEIANAILILHCTETNLFYLLNKKKFMIFLKKHQTFICRHMYMFDRTLLPTDWNQGTDIYIFLIVLPLNQPVCLVSPEE